jgi:hypothetical protein
VNEDRKETKDGPSKAGVAIIVAVGLLSLLFCLGTAFLLFGVAV